ncbi:MAG: 50S ribosomal protein L3 [Spirochaetes bacterium]|nr:50S ribosomal protein L3 [Spirochaetota bacterium]
MSNRIGLIGEKIGMTRIFDTNGNAMVVTVLKAGPCPIVQVKKKDKEGYNALKLAYKEIKEARIKRPNMGIFKKLKMKPHKILKEFKLDELNGHKLGDILNVEIFPQGSFVDVIGVTKGKGFQGVVKRWGFSGGPKTRGQSDRHRAAGSIGMCAWPSRVFKNKRMPGRMGHDKVTIHNLLVIRIDKEKNMILVKGSVPGIHENILLIRQSVKKKPMKVEMPGVKPQEEPKKEEAAKPVKEAKEAKAKIKDDKPAKHDKKEIHKGESKKESKK